jgi:hypothetical protein
MGCGQTTRGSPSCATPTSSRKRKVTTSDAYLEPWGEGLVAAFDLAQRLGRFAHAFGWVSLRRQLPAEERATYDVPFQVVLRRALALA